MTDEITYSTEKKQQKKKQMKASFAEELTDRHDVTAMKEGRGEEGGREGRGWELLSV